MNKLGPYELNQIYTGDARALAEGIPDNSVDLLVTDPPYFIPVNSYVGTRESGYARRTLGDMSVMQTYFDVMFGGFLPKLKSNGSAYVFCDAQSYPLIYRSMYPFFRYVRLLVWDKILSYNGYTWRHQHELIAWGEGIEAERIPTSDGDVLEFRGVLQKDRLHPAEKPVDLIMKLIAKHGTGLTVLDPYTGSGPVAEAAIRTGNNFLCFEIDPPTVEAANGRVRLAQPPLLLPEPSQLEMALPMIGIEVA